MNAFCLCQKLIAGMYRQRFYANGCHYFYSAEKRQAMNDVFKMLMPAKIQTDDGLAIYPGASSEDIRVAISLLREVGINVEDL